LLPLSSEISINIHEQLQEESSIEKSTRSIEYNHPDNYPDHEAFDSRKLQLPQYQKTNRYHVYVPSEVPRQTQKSYNGYSVVENGIVTPFLKANALQGPFIPIVKKTNKINHVDTQKQRNDQKIYYGKLWELKPQYQIEQGNQPTHTHTSGNYPTLYKIQPDKTVIRTYSPVKIDVPTRDEYQTNITQNVIEIQNDVQPHFYKQKITEVHSNGNYGEKQKQPAYRVPILLIQRPSYSEEVIRKPSKPVIYVRTRPQKPYFEYSENLKSYSSPIVEENYVAQKFVNPPKYQNVHVPLPEYPHDYQQNYYEYQTEDVRQNPNTNSLGVILKQLQKDNALPQTLTVNNIDNSIRTLVKILNSLKKNQRPLKPIVVAEENDKYISREIIADTYPKDHQEGGTPGISGVDYPALDAIPPTSFDCKTQRYKGFFGDPETNCQVWHYCDLNGGQASFLCPNGTIFSQVALTCDWWYNVKCSSTPQLYVLNERLYKYILPFAPKFPEDYTGPLVDKYLALKFMEMEEKMERERKGKQNKTKETTPEDDSTEEPTEVTAETATIIPN
ncbi:hypothetical protein HHI36_016292, partial [Cryptolaemus montrouzieri]